MEPKYFQQQWTEQQYNASKFTDDRQGEDSLCSQSGLSSHSWDYHFPRVSNGESHTFLSGGHQLTRSDLNDSKNGQKIQNEKPTKMFVSVIFLTLIEILCGCYL